MVTLRPVHCTGEVHPNQDVIVPLRSQGMIAPMHMGNTLSPQINPPARAGQMYSYHESSQNRLLP